MDFWRTGRADSNVASCGGHAGRLRRRVSWDCLGQEPEGQPRRAQQCHIQRRQARQSAWGGGLLFELRTGIGQAAGAGEGTGDALAHLRVQDGVTIQAW